MLRGDSYPDKAYFDALSKQKLRNEEKFFLANYKRKVLNENK